MTKHKLCFPFNIVYNPYAAISYVANFSLKYIGSHHFPPGQGSKCVELIINIRSLQ